jgi:hypothetical protein
MIHYYHQPRQQAHRANKKERTTKMNIIKYITQAREAGNFIDAFETREEAEAAIRAYEEEDRANDCYEEDFYAIKEPIYTTDCGDYTLVAHIAEGGDADEHIDIYIGRAADGHHDMIVSDNASMWVVGNDDDAKLNRSHWDLIANRIGDIDFAAISAIDADLAMWLEECKEEAESALCIVRRDEYDDGDMSSCRVINCDNYDDYDAIYDCWPAINHNDVIVRGLGGGATVLICAMVTDDIRTIDGLQNVKADYFVADYSTDCGIGDCDKWEFYTADGVRLTSTEDIFA